MDFGATSLYLSVMWDEKSVNLKMETGFAFKSYMILVYVKTFNDQIFNQDRKESAILQKEIYIPPNLLFQHLPVKEKDKIIEVNSMTSGYIIDTLTIVDIQEIVKIG